MSSETNVKGYAPLPQSISTDTEDDEDEHHPQHNHQYRRDDDNRSRISDTTTICQNGRFYPLDETKNIASKTRNGRTSFAFSNDSIPIMILNGQSEDDLWKKQDMSPLRKCCLVLSVLVCIATILVFLFVIPCDNSSICRSAAPPKTSVSWDKTLEGVELHGKITIIPGSPYNLIFLLRGQQFGDVGSKDSGGQQQIDKNGGGVLSMQGTSGIPLWWVVLKRLPIDISCDLIDTDGSGKPDCLVSGEGGLLVSIEPIAGTIHWNAQVHTTSELPLVLSDLDADRINDLIGVEITNTSQNLVFLSGKSGKLLMRQAIPDCQYVKLNRVDLSFVLTFTCYNSDSGPESRTILLKNFVESQNLKEIHRRYILNSMLPPKPIYPNQTSPTSWDLTAHYRLYVKNAGGDDCPSPDCRTSVDLTLRNNINESTIWNHTSPSSFVTKPAIVNTTNLPYIAGFALKFWSWSPDNHPPPKEDSDELPVRQRNITERVSFVYVNRTEVHEMKPSMHELVQFCRGRDCQPNLPRQTRSILIADLNNDGIMELISYGSSYSQAENSSRPSLTSRVQIVKLEQIF